MTADQPNHYIVSLCMAGFPCRYNGTDKFNQIIAKLIDEGRAFPLCPELLGGLPTPREPVECIKIDGKLHAIGQSGKDYTAAFQRGAEQVLKFAQEHHITKAILYKNSSSCGVVTYDGTFSGTLANYSGFTAQLLSDNGIEVISSADLEILEPNL
mgnify:CR=1 FL=1